MPAYVIADIDVHDAEKFEEYKKLSAPSAAPFGAKYLVRGGKVEGLEGAWLPRRFVVIEFPSLEKAKEWWNSQNYAGAKAIRRSCAKSNFILVKESEKREAIPLNDTEFHLHRGSGNNDRGLITQRQLLDCCGIASLEALKLKCAVGGDRHWMDAEHVDDLDHKSEPLQFLHSARALDHDPALLKGRRLKAQFDSATVLAAYSQRKRRKLHCGTRALHRLQFVIAGTQASDQKRSIPIDRDILRSRRRGPIDSVNDVCDPAGVPVHPERVRGSSAFQLQV